jgi:hypothetical protein
MRRRNPRLIWTGAAMVALAVAFYAGMLTMAAGHSHDPAAMMGVVGEVSGVVGALGVCMAVIGLIGKKL